MARGSKPGERRGGRVAGVRNKATQDQRDAVAASGQTPLDYMLSVMRDPEAPSPRRDAMATAAAPYVHPKLAAVEFNGTVEHEAGAELRALLESINGRNGRIPGGG